MSTELVTFFDDATGERVGLSATDLGAWAAATARLLSGECGLPRGSRAGVLLPPHWQTAAVLLGTWAAGIEVSFRGWSTAGLGVVDPLVPADGRAGDTGPALDATFVERRRVGSWLDHVPRARHQFVLGLAPAGRPAPDVPDGYRDFPTAARPHLGAAPPPGGVDGARTATVDGTTFGEYGAVAAEVARSRGLNAGDRVLIDTATHEEPLIWLMAPLTAGASIVLCANLDRSRLDSRVSAEHVTHVW